MDEVHTLIQSIYRKYEEHLELMTDEEATNFLIIHLAKELIEARRKYYKLYMEDQRTRM
jgi:hypothetical protein